MTTKSWIAVIVLTLGLLGGMVWMSQNEKTNVDNIDHTAIQSATDQSGAIADHVYGNKDAKVTLIEYGDYQCPGCGSAAPVVKQLSEKYKDDVAFVFRHKPIVTAHPNAMAAAASAESAGLQGKYWEMHDRLFENQSAWNQLTGENRTNYFVGLATSLGLDEAKFKEDLDSPEVRKKINFDASLADKAGISGTPTFFVNGKQVTEDVLNGKLVPANTKDARAVWAEADTFDTLILIPALEKAGVKTSK